MDFGFDVKAPVADWLPTVTYPGYRPGFPDIVLGRLPLSIQKITGQVYKSFIIENPKEATLLSARLAEPIPIGPKGELDFVRGPDSAVRKAGKGASIAKDILVMLYSPPEKDWPYLVVISMPVHDPNLERGCYAWEAFDTEEGAMAHMEYVGKSLPMSPTIVTSVDKPH